MRQQADVLATVDVVVGLTRTLVAPEQFVDTENKVGKYVLASQRGVAEDVRLAAVCTIHACHSTVGIHDPHEPAAGAQPIRDFGQHFARPIVRRQDLHREIRRDVSESSRKRVRNAVGPNEARVWCAHGVGIAEELESHLGSDDDAKLTRSM